MPTAENPLLILGSGSPRRAALLHQIGLPFVQWTSAAQEPQPGGESPAAHALAAARSKARAVHCLVRAHYPARRTIVIGADTVVHLEGRILGKPAHAEEAAQMLRSLAGRTHQVYTGVALVGSDGRQPEGCEVTQVRMRRLGEAEIRQYVGSGEPADKAGAYAIQGRGARFIESIEGCYYNVVGLPLARLSTLLAEAGYDFSIPSDDPKGL